MYVQANIHALLESERQVEALMEGLDKAIDALDRIDECINAYDDALTVILSIYFFLPPLLLCSDPLHSCFCCLLRSPLYIGSEE